MKNSDSFKSFEEKVGGAYESVKVIKLNFILWQILNYKISSLNNISDKSFNFSLGINTKFQRYCKLYKQHSSNYTYSRGKTYFINLFLSLRK